MPPEVYSVLLMFAVTFAVLIPLTALFEWMMTSPKEGAFDVGTHPQNRRVCCDDDSSE